LTIADSQTTDVPLTLLSLVLGAPARISEMKTLSAPPIIEHAWNCGCAAVHFGNEADVARWRACDQHNNLFFTRRNNDAKSDAKVEAPKAPTNGLRPSLTQAIAPFLLLALTVGGFGASSLLRRVRQAESEALIDSLTGLYNRRGWDKRAAAETRRLQREPAKMSIFIMDVDDLKTINDRDGHAAGDAILEKVASVIHMVKRDNDLAARLGGDEFGLLAVDAGTEDADKIAWRLAEAFAAATLSISIGRADVTPEGGIIGAIERADRAMYGHKERRKNDRRAIFEHRVRKA
jgi:diguanylate cyclase (GGDEF)-like protein